MQQNSHLQHLVQRCPTAFVLRIHVRAVIHQFPVSCRSGVSIVENRQSSFFSGRPMVEFILQKEIFPRDQPRSNSNGLAQEFFDLILSFRLIISCRLAEQHGKTRAQSRARVR